MRHIDSRRSLAFAPLSRRLLPSLLALAACSHDSLGDGTPRDLALPSMPDYVLVPPDLMPPPFTLDLSGADLASPCGANLVDDPHNCGACGHDCLGGACTSGQCQPVELVTALVQPKQLAVDGTSVYFTSGGNLGSVMKCAIAGCNGLAQTLASGLDNPDAIAVDASNVYWVNDGQYDTTPGSVMSCAIGGCGNQPTTLAAGLASPGPIALDGTNVYFGVGVGDRNDVMTGTVELCAKAGCGGVGTPLASGQSADCLASDGTTLYWGNADYMAPTIASCAVAGCSNHPTVLATGDNTVLGVALVGPSLIWSASNVMRCTLPGCTGSMQLMPQPVGQIENLVADEHDVYVLTVDGASGVDLLRCPIGGCPNGAVTMATGLGYNRDGLAQDATSLYVADKDHGRIVRIAK